MDLGALVEQAIKKRWCHMAHSNAVNLAQCAFFKISKDHSKSKFKKMHVDTM
jgi:hypothetical protein